jgi:ribosome-binding ATPase
VAVHDWQIKELVKVAKPGKVTPCQIEFWDIAGLIKGASEGAGLGNKFLANIREVNAIVHLVRAFKDLNVIYSEGDVNALDPIGEMEDVQTELVLSDLEICARKKLKKGLNKTENEIWQKVYKCLDDGIPVRKLDLTLDEIPIVKTLPLITAKPLIFAVNVDSTEPQGNELSKKFVDYITEHYPEIPHVVLSSTLEEELVQLKQDEGDEAAVEYMELAGLENSALDQLLEQCSNVLGLQKFYTAGPSHVSSWLVPKGATAPQAAGSIHGGFEKAFICTEICKV